jgi:hypothetical protein
MNFAQCAIAIDEAGERIKLTQAEIGRRLGTRLPSEKLLHYAVSKMGWVAISAHGDKAEVAYDRATVSHLALIGTIDWISRQKCAVLVHELAGLSTQHTVPNTIVYLSELIEQRKPFTRFKRAQVPVERSPFARLMPTAMEILHSDIELDTRIRLLDSLLDRRYSVNTLDAGNGHYNSLEMGDCIAGFDRIYAKAKIGQTYHSFVDPDFGTWMANCFAEMSVARAAHVEEVTVALKSGPRPGPIEYTRLLMPFERPGGKFLLVASDVPEF